MQSVTEATERALLRSGLVKRVVTRVHIRPPSYRMGEQPHQGKKECERRKKMLERELAK